MSARTVLLVLGTVGAVGLTGGAAVGTVDQIARQDDTTFPSVPEAERYVVRTDGRVDVSRGPLRLQVSRSWSFRAPELRTTRNGEEVRLEASCAGTGPCDVDLHLTVPAGVELDVRAGRARIVGTRGALTVEAHGDVEVTRHTGALVADSHGSDVRLTGVRGDVDVTTRGGDVSGSGLVADRVRLRAFGGEVDLGLTGAPSRVDAEVLGGDLLLQVPPGDYDLEVETRGGDEELGVEDVDGADAQVRLVSTGGDVVVTAG